MSWNDDPELYVADEAEVPGPEDDPAVQAIEPELLALFVANREAVYYETQLSIMFEQRFFHWVTARALKALRDSGRLGSHLEILPDVGQIRFYFHRSNRYWKRRAVNIRTLVHKFSAPAVTRAIGSQGELLIDAGLPRVGFMLWQIQCGHGVLRPGQRATIISTAFSCGMAWPTAWRSRTNSAI